MDRSNEFSHIRQGCCVVPVAIAWLPQCRRNTPEGYGWNYHLVWCLVFVNHYTDVIMTTIVSQITSLTIVYSTVSSDADQTKHQSSASLAFVRGINRSPDPAQIASNAENVCTWWLHHDESDTVTCLTRKIASTLAQADVWDGGKASPDLPKWIICDISFLRM